MSAQPYNRVQLYSENTNIRYPVEDTCEEPIPFGLLVDAAVAVPENLVDVRITNIVRAPTYVFLSLESGSEPVGHLFVLGPVAFRIYPLTMSCAGAGWVVFGPDIGSTYDLRGIDAPLDRRCILPNVATERQFKLRVNGMEYPMPAVLRIQPNYFLAQAVEDRTYVRQPVYHDTYTGSCLTLRRNDVVLAQELLRSGLIDNDFTDMPIFTINRIGPDVNGDFTLGAAAEDPAESVALTAFAETGHSDQIGFLVSTGAMAGCIDPYRDLTSKIKKGKSGYGTAYDLPLDIYVADDSSSSSPP